MSSGQHHEVEANLSAVFGCGDARRCDVADGCCASDATHPPGGGEHFRNVRVQHAGWCLQRARSKLADHTKVRVPKRFIIPPGELFEAVKLISGAMVGDMNGTYGAQSIAEDLTWAEAFLKHWWVDNNGKEYLI